MIKMIRKNVDQNTLRIVVSFYENALNGFQFKSYEGLFCKKDGSCQEKVKPYYSPKVKNIERRTIYTIYNQYKLEI